MSTAVPASWSGDPGAAAIGKGGGMIYGGSVKDISVLSVSSNDRSVQRSSDSGGFYSWRNGGANVNRNAVLREDGTRLSHELPFKSSGAVSGSNGRGNVSGDPEPTGMRHMNVDNDGKKFVAKHANQRLNELPVEFARLDSSSHGKEKAKRAPIPLGMRQIIENKSVDGKRDGFSRGFSKVRITNSNSQKNSLGESNAEDMDKHTSMIEELHPNVGSSLGEALTKLKDVSEVTWGDEGRRQHIKDDETLAELPNGKGNLLGEMSSLSNEDDRLQDVETKSVYLDAGHGPGKTRKRDDARHGVERAHGTKRDPPYSSKQMYVENLRPRDGFPNVRQLNRDAGYGVERAHDVKREGLSKMPRPQAGREDMRSTLSSPSPDVRFHGDKHGGARGSFEMRFDNVGEAQGWNVAHPRGQKPEPRYFHAATVVGRKVVVAGGDTAFGPSNDVKMLHLGRMMWSELGVVGGFVNEQGVVTKPASSEQLPVCKGHSLISWGKTLLLVGGEMDPVSDRTEVWSFDLETECWTKVAAKGEIPVARNGQSVTRAGSILIMFGGEDAKGHKLNDLHILDLKSLMWLPLHTAGAGPSPRTRHSAAMYDDRFLLIFGGASKSKPLNDVFALDFETMEWSKLKTKGINPSPRSGHAGVLVGDKWFIAGGENRGFGVLETLVLDVGKVTWSVVAVSSPNSAVANQGLSMVLVQRKDKTMLVTFGGKGAQLSNEVQVLYLKSPDYVAPLSPPGTNNVEISELRNNSGAPYSALVGAGLPCACVDVAKTRLLPLVDQRFGPRTSPGESPSAERIVDATPGLVPLRKQYAALQEGSKNSSVGQLPEEILSRVMKETSSLESAPSTFFKDTDWQNQDPESRFSEGDTPPRPASQPIMHTSKPVRKPGGSSRRKESFDSNLSSALEAPVHLGSSQRETFDLDVNTCSRRPHGGDCYDSHATATVRNTSAGEECTDGQLLADLQDANSMERRIHLINRYRQSFEMRLAAAMHRNELTAGHLTAALIGKEEVEKNLASLSKSKQKAEGKLAAALKVQMDLKDRVVFAEQAQEDSNNLCNVVHSENLRLEHDLAFFKAVLEDTQKELHSTRGVLAGERARAFQLQMEVFDLKQKVAATTGTDTQHLTSSGQSAPSASLTSSPVLAQA